MLSVIFGLSAALGFGASDFLGGISARRIGALRTVLVTAWTSLAALWLGSLVLPQIWSNEAVYYGGLSGLCGVIAIVFLYGSLAIGPMSILSPVGALVGALLPTLWDFFLGELLSWFAYVAIALALVAVVIVGASPEKNAVKPRIRGVIYAVLAGAFFAAYYILLDLAPDDGGLIPLIANRTVSSVSVTIAFVAVVAWGWMRRRKWRAAEEHPHANLAVRHEEVIDWRGGLPIALGTGVIEAIGTSLVLYGLIAGNLTVVSVLTSLYPAGTILLATLVLKERIGTLQYIGLGIALVAAAGLALA